MIPWIQQHTDQPFFVFVHYWDPHQPYVQPEPVHARLIYRRAFRFLVDDKGWTKDGHGRPLEDVQMWSLPQTTAVAGAVSVPNRLSLAQNYPNPFNPQTHISYELPESGPVSLQVFNLLGATVRTLVEEDQQAGGHALNWDGRDDAGRPLGAGTYFYRLQASAGVELRKMLLIRRLAQPVTESRRRTHVTHAGTQAAYQEWRRRRRPAGVNRHRTCSVGRLSRQGHL